MNKTDDLVDEAANNQSGAKAEANGNVEQAIQLYEKNIKKDIADSFPFDRLMILYRRQKRYKDELRVINRGIEVFNNQLQRQQQQLLSHSKSKSQLQKLSALFGKKTGLDGKKGAYVPAPVGKWLKRKEVVQAKLKKSK